jgi:endonuclease III
MTHEKDLDKMDAVKKEYENLKEQAENIESEDIKERLKEKIETMSEYLKKKEQDYEKELRKCGFSRDEEYLYRRYMKIEKELDKDVNKFIKKLEAEIPKLKEFHLEG